MFDNWYVVQVRTGKEEEIVKKCQFYIDHDILIDCFIPITKKKKKYQGTWHIVDDILFKGYIFIITNQVEQLYTQLKKVPDLTKLLGNDGKEIYPIYPQEAMFLTKFSNKNHVVDISNGIIENDKIIINEGPLVGLEGLMALYQQGWDIDYIITGQENHRTVLNDLYDSCNKERRADFLQYMVWTVRQGIKSYEKHIKQMERYIEKFEYFNMYTSGIAAEDTAFYGIRNRLSQVQMAKMLHVDIKKYRAMEKNEKKPDAELLMLLYNNFECMPFETIYGESDLGEINAVWRKLPPQMQDELYAFMKQGLRFIDNQTGDTKV